MRIAFIGNFLPEHSTENDILKSLKILGHEVTTFQEDVTPFGPHPGMPCRPNLVLWCHTHGWDPPNGSWREVFTGGAVPYVAFTLDLFRGLARHDPTYVKANPWFTCDYFYQPDDPDWLQDQGGSFGINAHFSAPAILETSAYAAAPDPLHPAYGKIVFVGSRNYHPEWPWRQEMLECLDKVYGDRFQVYDHSSGMRGHNLNVLYASAAVVVGDSCFASQDSRYTSDRLYESLGRGANLVYPWINYEFDPMPYLVPYVSGSCNDLIRGIDYALEMGQSAESRLDCVELVRRSMTYTDRLRVILEKVMG